MSAWIIGLALAAGYLINKNVTVRTQLEDASAEYHSTAAPATGGVTSAEVRKTWRDTDHTRFGEMTEQLPEAQKRELDQKVQAQQAAVESFDASTVYPIQGVLLTYDGLGY